MEKINFINQSTPALNATNLNKLQDNVEDAIQETQDDVTDLNTNKLDKSSVKTTKTASNTDTYSCNYIDNEIKCTYSTTETKTNKYWNNKPIYTKIIQLSQSVSASTTSATIQLPLTNIDRIWLDPKSTIVESNNVRVPFPNINGATTSYIMGYYLLVTNGVPSVMVRKGNNLGINSEEFVVEYTKTTD